MCCTFFGPLTFILLPYVGWNEYKLLLGISHVIWYLTIPNAMEFPSQLAVSTTLFSWRCMFKKKKYLAPTLANKKLTAYLIASFHSISFCMKNVQSCNYWSKEKQHELSIVEYFLKDIQLQKEDISVLPWCQFKKKPKCRVKIKLPFGERYSLRYNTILPLLCAIFTLLYTWRVKIALSRCIDFLVLFP